MTVRLKGSKLVKCSARKCGQDNYLLPGTKRACSGCGKMLTGPAKKTSKRPKHGKRG